LFPPAAAFLGNRAVVFFWEAAIWQRWLWSHAPCPNEATSFLRSHPSAGVVKETFMGTSKR